MTSPIQLLLTALVSGIGIIALARMGKPLVGRLSILAVVIFGVISVANPDLTTRVAHLLGVGRGADLLIYLGSLTFAYLFLLGHLRMLKAERQLRQLVREISIQSAKIQDPALQSREVKPG